MAKSLLEQWQDRALSAEKKVKQATELLKGSTGAAAKRAVDVLRGEYEVKMPEEKTDKTEEPSASQDNAGDE